MKAQTCLPTRRGYRTDPHNFLKSRVALDWGIYEDARLNEAKITLDRGPDVLHPLNGSLLMGDNRTGPESMTPSVHGSPLGVKYSRLNVLIDHLRLVVIGRILSGLEIRKVSRQLVSGKNVLPLSRHR